MKNQVSSPDELTCDDIGSCNPKLIYCPKCSHNKVASSWEYSTHFSWGLLLCCNECGTIWLICRRCPKVRSRFCFGSDMLQHNKDKHLHDMSQTVGVKCPLNEVDGSADPPIATASILEKTTTDTDLSAVDGSAAPPNATNILEETTTDIDLSEVEGSAAHTIATASILEKTTTDSDPSEVDDGSAAPPNATANIVAETKTDIDPSEVDGSVAPPITTASILETTTVTEHAMDSFISNGSCSPCEEGHLNSIGFVSVTSDDAKQRNINAIYSTSNASLAVDNMSLASIPMFIGDDSLMFDNLLDQTSSFPVINPIDNIVPDESNINFFAPSFDLNYASSTNPLSNPAMSYCCLKTNNHSHHHATVRCCFHQIYLNSLLTPLTLHQPSSPNYTLGVTRFSITS